MDIRELNIGDWVYNTHHGRNIRLTAYDFFTHGHINDGGQYLTPFSKPSLGRDLEPIPLTPEILEGNGFRLWFTSDEEDAMSRLGMTAEKGWVWDGDGGSVKVMFPDKPDKSDGGMAIISDQNFDIYMVFYFNEIYVHELQHMMRLCRVDKKIELL